MRLKLQVSKEALKSRWGWTSLAAVLVLIILNLADGALKARTGAGTLDLQFASSGPAVRFIMDRWQTPADATLVGFLLGLDFLLIPLYGAALYFGCIAARERFAPGGGALRRLLDAVSIAPLVAVLCDVVENMLEMSMLTQGPNPLFAMLSYQATMLKWASGLVGLIPALIAAGALLFCRLGRKTS